jgi:hypothetical protein
MRRSTGFLTLSAAAIMALGACSDTPAGPTQTLPTLNADIANAVADGVGEDVQLMRDLNFGLRTGCRPEWPGLHLRRRYRLACL